MSGEARFIARYDGDVLVFGTLSSALSYIEVPDVESGEATLIATSGVWYKLGVERGGWFRPDLVEVIETVAATEQELSELDAALRTYLGSTTEVRLSPDALLWELATELPIQS